jgi:hypothetical protein
VRGGALQDIILAAAAIHHRAASLTGSFWGLGHLEFLYQRNFHPLATSASWLYSLIPNRACGFALNKGSTAALGMDSASRFGPKGRRCLQLHNS